jgi:hypothetical protein
MRLAARLLAVVALAWFGCTIPAELEVVVPEPGQLALVGPVDVVIGLPDDALPETLTIELDGASVRALFPAARAGVPLYAALPVPAAGDHTLDVTLQVEGGGLETRSVAFETVALENPAQCEPLNAVECLLPYPSSRFEVRDPTTATGVRLSLPAAGFPQVIGAPTSPAPYDQLDGWSPTAQITMHFPGGVDLALSDAPMLVPAGAPQSPPFVGIRMPDGRSLENDSPTVLLDADTGERVFHWVELDARAAANPARQALFLRAGKVLRAGGRYVVAVRGLRHPDGSLVEAEPAFAALRDARPTSIESLRRRAPRFEEEVFAPLAAAGIDRASLQLAWDFTVQSQSQQTRQIMAMRDRAYAWIDAEVANPATQLFTIPGSGVQTFDCAQPNVRIWRRIAGTFRSPLFLAEPPGDSSVAQHTVDAADLPVQNGTMDAAFTISIPCSALDPAGPTLHPLVLGHGLFGRGTDMVDGVPPQVTAALADPASGVTGTWRYIAGATDWRGLSGLDLFWIAGRILGNGSSQLNNFPAFPDRLRQGMLNTIVLTRLMKTAHFNRNPAFVTPDGRGVFAGPGVDAYYYGISLGGIMGTYLAGLSPDLDRLHVDVPAINFNFLLQRSTQFTTFEAILGSIGLTDPLDRSIGLALTHELWVSAEPASVATHVTGLVDPPLPGVNAKRIQMSVAWLDKQVSNQASELAARSLGLGNLDGSLLRGFQGIPDVTSPQDSAMTIWSTGSFDLWNPAHQPYIPPLDNRIPSSVCDPHGGRPSIRAGVQQMLDFLQPGGLVANTCSGVCDAAITFEQPANGVCVPPP